MTDIITNGESVDRFYPLEGVFNFRDLGGYKGLSDKRVKMGRVFRSDNLGQLTAKDLNDLKKLELRTVLDLRTEDELLRRGSYAKKPDTSARFVHIPLMDVSADPERAKTDSDYLTYRYKEILTEGAPSLYQVFRTISDPDSHPVVFHCAVGKDRTGVVAMVLLGVLGVEPDTIVQDYALTQLAVTNMLTWLDNISPDMARYVRSLPASLMAAEPRTMSQVIDWLVSTYGGFEEYLKFIGVTESEISSLRRSLLG
jgi:protein-tyrosine phosphatase